MEKRSVPPQTKGESAKSGKTAKTFQDTTVTGAESKTGIDETKGNSKKSFKKNKKGNEDKGKVSTAKKEQPRQGLKTDTAQKSEVPQRSMLNSNEK